VDKHWRFQDEDLTTENLRFHYPRSKIKSTDPLSIKRELDVEDQVSQNPSPEHVVLV
jgi:hypothetical protein